MFQITNPELKNRLFFGSTIATATLICMMLGGFPFNAFVLAIAILASAEVFVIISKGDEDSELKNIEFYSHSDRKVQKNHYFLAFLAVLLPSASAIFLRGKGIDYILWVIISIWIYDTVAFFSGRTFKGPKLMPSVSPNKTISGFVCGVGATAFFSMVYLKFFGFSGSFLFALLLSVLLPVLSQAGDLLESKFKRIYDVKDGSDLIPGHGGIIDRIDGMILTLPFLFIVSVFNPNLF